MTYGFGRLSAVVAVSLDRPAPPCFASGALSQAEYPACGGQCTTGHACRPPTLVQNDFIGVNKASVKQKAPLCKGSLGFNQRFACKGEVTWYQSSGRPMVAPTAEDVTDHGADRRRRGIFFATAHRTRSRAVLNHRVMPHRMHLNAQSLTPRRPTDFNPSICESFCGFLGSFFQKAP